MLPMFVTLDVSKLSGWLNTIACCQDQKEASEEGRHAGREAGGRGVEAAQVERMVDPSAEACWQGTRGAHPKHGLRVSEAGRVEAQRLVER